ncbi:hypothetical protein [Streptomyces clavifer]|uniref:hypothetical protein n=1 Tax=Streptomyces clavifer TaxID=68188 RepID=UPI003685E87D
MAFVPNGQDAPAAPTIDPEVVARRAAASMHLDGPTVAGARRTVRTLRKRPGPALTTTHAKGTTAPSPRRPTRPKPGRSGAVRTPALWPGRLTVVESTPRRGGPPRRRASAVGRVRGRIEAAAAPAILVEDELHQEADFSVPGGTARRQRRDGPAGRQVRGCG